jgi:hypothetical protein
MLYIIDRRKEAFFSDTALHQRVGLSTLISEGSVAEFSEDGRFLRQHTFS